jgi:hypothetical protein
LPKTAKWRSVVDLLDAGRSVPEVVGAAVNAAEASIKRASTDPAFLSVVDALVMLPLVARGPGYHEFLAERGVSAQSLPDLLIGLGRDFDRTPAMSDLGEMARLAYVTALGSELEARLPSLFEPSPADVRAALGHLASGQGFAGISRRFFAELTRRTLAYYLSRELAQHTGAGRRFTDDRQRVEFDRALSDHTWQASAIVSEFAAGWYGKTIWQGDGPTPEKIANFSAYAFKKLRDELARRRNAA